MANITCPTCHFPRPPASAHCAGCHRTFGGDTAFDMHRRQEGSRRVCADPLELTNEHGLARLVLKNGVWRTPAPEFDQAA